MAPLPFPVLPSYLKPMTISKPHANSAALQRVRTVSHLLDNAIAVPGTTFRVGIDPILGLLPGAGDWLSAILSVYLVLESMRFGLPAGTLFRMLGNLLLDAIVGTVPVLGDFLDFTLKANHRNMRLLEAHIQNPRPQKAHDRIVMGLVILVLIVFIVAVSSIAFMVINGLLSLIRGS
jgi:Domain of unknown function (DUF4112)